MEPGANAAQPQPATCADQRPTWRHPGLQRLSRPAVRGRVEPRMGMPAHHVFLGYVSMHIGIFVRPGVDEHSEFTNVMYVRPPGPADSAHPSQTSTALAQNSIIALVALTEVRKVRVGMLRGQ